MLDQINDTNNRLGHPALGPIPSLAPNAAFNLNQIEDLLKNKGILAFHVKHALDYRTESTTLGLDLSNDVSRPFVYYDIRPLLVIPQQFNLNETLSIVGLNQMGTTVMNVTGHYLDNPEERVFLRPKDLIILNPTITDLYSQLFTFENTTLVRLRYRVRSVDYMACRSRGRLELGRDFEITELGEIQFLGKWPELNEVVSIVYEKQQIYVVNSIPHLLRILPENNIGHAAIPRKARYAPQLIFVDRSTTVDTKDSIDFFNLPEIVNYEQWLPEQT